MGMKYIVGLVGLLMLSAAVEAQKNVGITWGGALDSLQAEVEILRYDLDLVLDLEEESIGGKVGIRYRMPEGQTTLRLDLLQGFEVSKVYDADGELEFSHVEDFLDITAHGGEQEVFIEYSGTPMVAARPPWSGGFTWSEDSEGRHWQGLSSQNAGGKIFMPCLNHPSSRAAEGVRLAITVPEPYVVAANGRLEGVEEDGNLLTYHWVTDYPISNYNINFTTGYFERSERPFISVSGDTVPMVVYLLEEDADRAEGLMDVLGQAAATHESYFGPYPFPEDKLAVVQTPYLGMEHQTINAYGNKFRFDTVDDVIFDWLLHHELGHEWWGNKLSVADWADFWLHEGFCTYGDWLAREAYVDKEKYLNYAKSRRLGILFLKPLVPERPASAHEAYHREVYTKGAFVLHSLRWILGDETFFDLLRDIAGTSRFSYENQWSTADFMEMVSEYTDRDLDDFFEVMLFGTEPLEMTLTEWSDEVYSLQFDNIDNTLPVEVQVGDEVKVLEVGSKSIFISTPKPPVIDPNGWLLTKVKKS